MVLYSCLLVRSQDFYLKSWIPAAVVITGAPAAVRGSWARGQFLDAFVLFRPYQPGLAQTSLLYCFHCTALLPASPDSVGVRGACASRLARRRCSHLTPTPSSLISKGHLIVRHFKALSYVLLSQPIPHPAPCLVSGPPLAEQRACPPWCGPQKT